MDQLRQIEAFFRALQPACRQTTPAATPINNPNSHDAIIPTAQAENTDHIPYETTTKHITSDNPLFHLCSIPNHAQNTSAPGSTGLCEAMNEVLSLTLHPAIQLNAIRPTLTNPEPELAIPPEQIPFDQNSTLTRFTHDAITPHAHCQSVPSQPMFQQWCNKQTNMTHKIHQMQTARRLISLFIFFHAKRQRRMQTIPLKRQQSVSLRNSDESCYRTLHNLQHQIVLLKELTHLLCTAKISQ